MHERLLVLAEAVVRRELDPVTAAVRLMAGEDPAGDAPAGRS
jgi:hypothetical protein